MAAETYLNWSHWLGKTLCFTCCNRAPRWTAFRSLALLPIHCFVGRPAKWWQGCTLICVSCMTPGLRAAPVWASHSPFLLETEMNWLQKRVDGALEVLLFVKPLLRNDPDKFMAFSITQVSLLKTGWGTCLRFLETKKLVGEASTQGNTGRCRCRGLPKGHTGPTGTSSLTSGCSTGAQSRDTGNSPLLLTTAGTF